MSQLIVLSNACMGPLEVSVYPPDGESIEFALSSGLTKKSLPASAGRYAVVARRPNGTRLTKVVAIKDKDETVDLAKAVGFSPNEFMTRETERGQVAQDPSASPQTPWQAVLTGVVGDAISRAAFTKAPLGIIELERLQKTRVPETLALRLWRLDVHNNWTAMESASAISTQPVEVSGDFVKITLEPKGSVLSLGLLDTSGFGPIVNVPPFAEAIEVTFLSKGMLVRAADRTLTPGGERIPVALVTPTNHAAADLLSVLAAPATPPAKAIWDQSAAGLMPDNPPDNPIQMLMEKFARPAEALLAAHYLLRFLPDRLSVAWADNLARAMQQAADGPVIAAWTRILNRPADLTDAQVDEAIDRNIALAFERPVTLFARTRALLFDALRLTSDEIAAKGRKSQGRFSRFGAAAGALESFWGGGPTLPGTPTADPQAHTVLTIGLHQGAFVRPPIISSRTIRLIPETDILTPETSIFTPEKSLGEEKHMGRPYTSSEVAWEVFMRGAELYRRFTPADNAKARAFFEKAIAEDQKFARAYANLAATHRQDYYGRWTQNPESSKKLAYDTVTKGVELAESEPEPKPSLPFLLEQRGWLDLYEGKYEKATQAAKEVVRRNHNSADGYILWAQVLVYEGQPQQALEKLQEASKRNPKFPYSYDYIHGQAHYVLGVQEPKGSKGSKEHFEKAEENFREALRKNDNYRPARSYLVAVLSELNRPVDAIDTMNISREKNEPLVTLWKSGNEALIKKQIREMTPFEDETISDRLGDAWLKAAN